MNATQAELLSAACNNMCSLISPFLSRDQSELAAPASEKHVLLTNEISSWSSWAS
jgi:hypothetical protein